MNCTLYDVPGSEIISWIESLDKQQIQQISISISCSDLRSFNFSWLHPTEYEDIKFWITHDQINKTEVYPVVVIHTTLTGRFIKR